MEIVSNFNFEYRHFKQIFFKYSHSNSRLFLNKSLFNKLNSSYKSINNLLNRYDDIILSCVGRKNIVTEINQKFELAQKLRLNS